jgi:hypothetical protein
MSIKLIYAFFAGLLAGGGGVGLFLKKRYTTKLDSVYMYIEEIKARMNFSEDEEEDMKSGVTNLRTVKIETIPEEEAEDDSEYGEDEEENETDDSMFDVKDPNIDFPLPEPVPILTKKPAPKKTSKQIYNISFDDYFDGEPDYAKTGIKFLPKTETFLDVNDEEINAEEAASVIGSGLLFFGLNSKDNDVVYIRNVKLKTDIEVVRMEE